MRSIFTLVATCFMFIQMDSQQTIHLRINHKLGNEPLALNQQAENNLGNTFTITRVDYYLSSISILHDGGQQTSFDGVYILSKGTNDVDVILGTADVSQVESITFSVGVETPVNNQDPAQWPSDHPLSYQSPSMHWGWSSGYRFAAMEGESGTSLNLNFELHGLGNDNYFSQTIPVSGTQVGDVIYINLDADYSEALRDINLSSGPINHGTNANDLTMLNNFKNYVFSPASGVVGVDQRPEVSLSVFPNPAKSSFQVSGLQEQAQIVLTDMMGRIVWNVQANPLEELDVPAAGTYVVAITTASGEVFTQKLIVEP